ncbi:hypothetical protein QR680_006151 [Steinernema hermaphroditum]|uniref:Uncharacterized protein n=1 Tax=Steinernema hermaphroditum TaxID=289476 RepID=A0AA39HWQ0_9BILA|nr:hypothetical protein QR680_006151 [Steinernema hermaphroditum]
MFWIPDQVTYAFQSLNIFIQYPSLLLNLIVFVVSFKVPPSIPRTFCLNLTVPCLLCSIYILFAHHSNAMYNELTQTGNPTYLFVMNTLDALLYQAALKSYETQATFSIFLAYMSLTRPFFHQQLISVVFIGFLLTHVVSWSIAIEMAMEGHWHYLTPYSEGLLYVHTVIRLTTEGLIYMTMLVLYVMTFVRLISFYRKTHGIPSNQSPRWRLLLSLLLYCTPPNLFLVVGIPTPLCDVSYSAACLQRLPKSRMLISVMDFEEDRKNELEDCNCES